MAAQSRFPLVFIGGVFLFVGAIFLLIGGGTLLESQRYRQQGTQAPAVTTGKSLRRATPDSDTAYEISYRIQPPTAAAIERTEVVGVDLWEGVERGSPLVVEYVNSDPATARVQRDRSGEASEARIAVAVAAVLVLIAVGLIVLAARGRRTPAAPASAFEPGPEPARHAGSFWPLARRSGLFWFGGIFLLVGVPLCAVGLFRFYDDWRFAREARETQGTALAKEIRRTRSSGSGSRRSNRHYEVVYRFAVNGETFTGRDELSADGWNRVVEREPIDVRYRASDPSSSRLQSRNAWVEQSFFVLLGALFGGIGGWIVTDAVRKARREWHLRLHGVKTQGTITRLAARNLKINKVQQWRLDYEYRDPVGNRFSAKFTLPEDEAQSWKVGDAGGVLYDPARPADAVWLGRTS